MNNVKEAAVFQLEILPVKLHVINMLASLNRSEVEKSVCFS
jgi:hypothetical protein